jgi:hypothetical protein
MPHDTDSKAMDLDSLCVGDGQQVLLVHLEFPGHAATFGTT